MFENEFGKGSNEISSYLFDCLKSIDLTRYKTVHLIIMVVEGGGQKFYFNKHGNIW